MSAIASLPRRAWRAASDPGRALREAAVLRDLLAFRRSYAEALRGARPRRVGAGNVLVISMSDHLYQLKLEGLLATALRLGGFKPVVLTLRGARWAEPYFRAYGVRDFVYPDELLSAEQAAAADRATASYLSGDVSVQSLKQLVFRGANVGRQTLSSLSRRFLQGRISLEDAEVRAALDEVLGESMRSVLRGEALLDRVQPEIALFIEKGYAGFGSIYDVALGRGVNVIQFVAAGIHWRDALLFKRFTEETRQLHPASLSRESWRRIRALPWTEERERELEEEFRIRYGAGEKHPDAGLQEGKRILSADEVRARLGLDPSKRTAVLFSHVLWDANLFYGEDLFDDQETWLVETVRAACANPAVNWVVKLHPANMYKAEGVEPNDEIAIGEAVGKLPPHVKLLRPETEINTFSLFSVADFGITIRGTIGMELPVYGIPVLTGGTGRYSGMGFTNDSVSAAEYLGKLARIQDIPRLSEEETLLAKRHAYGLFRLRPFRFSSYRAHFEHDRPRYPLRENLELTLRSASDVESAPDLRAFAEWAVDRSQLDYLSDLG